VNPLKNINRIAIAIAMILALIAAFTLGSVLGMGEKVAPMAEAEKPSQKQLLIDTEVNAHGDATITLEKVIAEMDRGVGYKTLQASELISQGEVKSRRELNGVESIRALLGDEKARYRARFIYFGDPGQASVSTDGEVSWYWYWSDKETKKRKSYFLYYQPNPVMRKAQPGDFFMLGRYGEDQLIALVAKKDSAASQALMAMVPPAAVNTATTAPLVQPPSETQKQTATQVASVLGEQLSQAGKVLVPIEVWRDVETGELSIIGTAEVKDGDTLRIDGVFDVRLIGVDAPEKKQTCDVDGRIWHCGEEARRTLAAMVEGKHVVCANRKKEKYGRFLSVCKVGDVTLNEAMTEQGLAVIYYTTEFAAAERRARLAHRGLWGSSFINPADWRKGVR
jgi:endonuclease YncB( thermonuclease family)